MPGHILLALLLLLRAPHAPARERPHALEPRGPGIPGIIAAVEAAYSPVQVSLAGESVDGRVVLYRVMTTFGTYDPRDPEGYRRAVREGSRRLNVAQVALLQLTVRHLARVEAIGVYEDSFLVPVWTRAQIEAAGRPESYADKERFRRFVGQARVLSPIQGRQG